MNKYSSYRSEMVSTDGRTDTEGYNIIPRHTLVAGYKKKSPYYHNIRIFFTEDNSIFICSYDLKGTIYGKLGHQNKCCNVHFHGVLAGEITKFYTNSKK